MRASDPERVAASDSAHNRLVSMALNPREANSLLTFLCGYSPDGVDCGLDLIERYRADAPADSAVSGSSPA